MAERQTQTFPFIDSQQLLFDTVGRILSFEKKCLAGFLAAISSDDIEPNTLESHDYRICSRHFLSGKPAG